MIAYRRKIKFLLFFFCHMPFSLITVHLACTISFPPGLGTTINTKWGLHEEAAFRCSGGTYFVVIGDNVRPGSLGVSGLHVE